MKTEKIPLEFVKKFLRARGWKWLHNVNCDCEFLKFIETEHPIKWLWEHIKQGHEPSFDCCHTWDRQIGRDTGEFDKYYKWWTFKWNKKYQDFELVDCYMGCEGFEEFCPSDIRRNQNQLKGVISTLPRGGYLY